MVLQADQNPWVFVFLRMYSPYNVRAKVRPLVLRQLWSRKTKSGQIMNAYKHLIFRKISLSPYLCGDVTATDLPIIDFVDDALSLSSVNPPAEIDTPELASASVLHWNVPTLSPGETQLLTHQGTLDPSTPIGKDIGRHACVAPKTEDIAACIDKMFHLTRPVI
jgi:hypothetical protein